LNWKEYISFEPDVCHGKAHFKGTRLMVSVILDCLAEGMKEEEMLENYLSLKKEHITAALQYAATLAREEVLPLTKSQRQESGV